MNYVTQTVIINTRETITRLRIIHYAQDLKVWLNGILLKPKLEYQYRGAYLRFNIPLVDKDELILKYTQG